MHPPWYGWSSDFVFAVIFFSFLLHPAEMISMQRKKNSMSGLINFNGYDFYFRCQILAIPVYSSP
jgi:hypothetical protein